MHWCDSPIHIQMDLLSSPSEADETSPLSFINDWMPWNNGEEPMSVYRDRSMRCTFLLIFVVVVYVAIFAVMFFRYHNDRVVVKTLHKFSGYTALFWIMFMVTIVWAILTVMCVWYMCIHYDLLGGILLAIVFILLLVALLASTIEEEHITIVLVTKSRYSV